MNDYQEPCIGKAFLFNLRPNQSASGAYRESSAIFLRSFQIFRPDRPRGNFPIVPNNQSAPDHAAKFEKFIIANHMDKKIVVASKHTSNRKKLLITILLRMGHWAH